MSLVDSILVLVYFGGITAVGLSFAGKSKTLKDFFVAERDIPWWAAMFSGVATIFSGITFLGGPALAFSADYSLQQLRLGLPLGLLILCRFVLPVFYRTGVTSIYEYLEQRFDARTRLLAAGSFVVLKTAYLGLVVYISSVVISLAFGLSVPVVLVATGMVTTVYTFLGGMRAVIWTDVIQLVILLTGVAVSIYLIFAGTPLSLSAIMDQARAAGRLEVFDFSFSLTETYTFWNGLIGGTILLIVQYGTDQAEVQRYLTTKSSRQANLALAGTAVFVMLISFAIFFIGTLLFAYYGQFPDKGGMDVAPDKIFPKFIVEEFPSGLKGLMVGAILSATMSTTSSVLNSLATVVSVDLLPRLQKRSVSIGQARMLTVMFGVAITAMGFFAGDLGSILNASNRFLNLVGGSLVGVFLLGIMGRFATPAGGFWGFAASLAAAVSLQVMTDVSFMWYGPTAAFTAITVGLLVSLVQRTKGGTIH